MEDINKLLASLQPDPDPEEAREEALKGIALIREAFDPQSEEDIDGRAALAFCDVMESAVLTLLTEEFPGMSHPVKVAIGHTAKGFGESFGALVGLAHVRLRARGLTVDNEEEDNGEPAGNGGIKIEFVEDIDNDLKEDQ
jgi:hypothetical protein